MCIPPEDGVRSSLQNTVGFSGSDSEPEDGTLLASHNVQHLKFQLEQLTNSLKTLYNGYIKLKRMASFRIESVYCSITYHLALAVSK
jgi:hypothetical protein